MWFFPTPGRGLALPFGMSDPWALVEIGQELLVDVAAVVTLGAGVKAAGGRPRSRMLLIAGLSAMAGIELLWFAASMVHLFLTVPAVLGEWGTAGNVMFLTYTVANTLRWYLVPLVLIWVLTRPALRQEFDRGGS
jgi:hypothetical protein